MITPPRKSDRIGLLFTQKKSDFGAISVTEQNCAAPISIVDTELRLLSKSKSNGLSLN